MFTVPVVRSLGATAPASGTPRHHHLLAVAGFFLPAFVLSAVHPMVVKLQLRDLGRTGGVVGRLSGISTFGALVGTFVTGFLLVATTPTRTVIYAIGGVLVALGHRARRSGCRGGTASSIAGDRGARRCGRHASAATSSRAVRPRERVLLHPRRARPAQRERAHPVARRPPPQLRRPRRPDAPRVRVHPVVRRRRRGRASPTTRRSTRSTSAAAASRCRATSAPSIPGTKSTGARDRPVGARHRTASASGLKTGPDLRVTDRRRAASASATAPTTPPTSSSATRSAACRCRGTSRRREFIGEVHRVLRPDGVYVLNIIDYPPLRFVRAELAHAAGALRLRRGDRAAAAVRRRPTAATWCWSPPTSRSTTRRCATS